MNANNKYRLSLVIGLALGILGLTLKFGNVLPPKSIPLRIIFGLSLLIIIVTLIIRRTSNSDKQNTDVRFFGKNSTMRPFIVVCVLIIFIFSIGYLSNYFNRDKIASFEKHKKIVVGIIVDYRFGGRSGTNYDYSFFANGKTYNGGFLSSILRDELLYKRFPVLYDSLNPDYNSMLVFPEDFKEYGIPFPDSLRWVKDL